MRKIIKLVLPLLIISTSILFCSGCTNSIDGPFGNDENLSNEELAEKYFIVSDDDLNGWEQGFTDGNNYILGTHIPYSDSTFFAISSAKKPNSYCYFLFNEDNSLIGLGTEDNWISAIEEDNIINLSWLDENNTICGDYIELMTRDNFRTDTKSIRSEILFDYDKMSRITSCIGYIQNGNNINKHTIEKEYGLLAKDIMSLSASLILDLVRAPAKLNIGLFLGEQWIDGFVSTHYKRFQLALYNECSTEITEISDDGKGNINLFVTIKNADSVPTELVRLYYPINEGTTNTVYCGIVGRERIYPTSVIFTTPYKEEGLLDRSWGKEIYLMYTFPIPSPDKSFVFRSYLKSTRITNDKGNVNNGYIKYSEPYYYNNVGYIDEFAQESCTYKEGSYIFKCKAHATIESSNTNEWGIYHSTDDLLPEKFYPKGYSEPSISSPDQAEFELEFKYPIEEFEKNAYKNIKLGVFSYNKSDNLTTWGNVQQFVLEVPELTTLISAHTAEPKELGNEEFSMEFDIKCDKLRDNYHLIILNSNDKDRHYYDEEEIISWKGKQITIDEVDCVYDFSGRNLFNTISCEFNPIYNPFPENDPTYQHQLVFIPCKYDQQKKQYTIIEKPIITEISFPAIVSEYSVISSTNSWDIHNSTLHFSHSGKSGYDNPIFSIVLVADVVGRRPLPIRFKVFPTKYNSWEYDFGASFFGIPGTESDDIVLEGQFFYSVTMNMKERTIYWQ